MTECCCCGCKPQSLFTGSESTPADAIALFDGKDLSHWVKRESDDPAEWKVENGYAEVAPRTGDFCTKELFTDCHVHVEFWLPLMADKKGQARANSGVYLQGRYEVQVLDSHELGPQDVISLPALLVAVDREAAGVSGALDEEHASRTSRVRYCHEPPAVEREPGRRQVHLSASGKPPGEAPYSLTVTKAGKALM